MIDTDNVVATAMEGASLAMDMAAEEIKRLRSEVEALREQAVRVKPLVFGRAEKSGMNLQADCAFGRYYIGLRPDNNWFWWRPASGPAHHGCETSEDQAMKAIQADYERRILTAIDTVSVAQVRKEALEEAASVADGQWERWNDMSGVECDVTACQNIAAAIRALAEKEGE